MLFGIGSLIWAVIVKATPAAWVEKIPIKFDEDKGAGDDNAVMKVFNKTLKGQVKLPEKKVTPTEVPVENQEPEEAESPKKK